MNGLAAVYGNHLGAQLLGLATAAAERTPRSGAPRPPSPSAPNASAPSKRWLPEQPQDDAQEEEEYEDEIIEEMSGNWAPGTNPNSTTTTSQAVPRVDSVEWTKMEEGPDDETQFTEPAEDDDPQVLRTLKRKRKSLDDKDLKDEKGTAGGAEQLPPGKKRLSCIDCGCRAALKACSKVMCIDCCPKEGRVCNAHAKKLYEKEVRKLDQPTGTEKEPHGKDKEGSGKQSAKKRSRVRALSGDGGEQEDDFSFGGEGGGGGGEEESDGTLGDRGADRNGDAAAGDEGEERGAKAKRSILYETIAKQDKKIRALQNDLKELRTLLLSVVDKQTAFSRQLRHISGHSDGLVIDEDDEGDEDGS